MTHPPPLAFALLLILLNYLFTCWMDCNNLLVILQTNRKAGGERDCRRGRAAEPRLDSDPDTCYHALPAELRGPDKKKHLFIVLLYRAPGYATSLLCPLRTKHVVFQK